MKEGSFRGKVRLVTFGSPSLKATMLGQIQHFILKKSLCLGESR